MELKEKIEELLNLTDGGGDVFRYYLKTTNLKGGFRNPMYDDKNASLYVTYYNGRYRFKDFGGSEDMKGDCVEFVKKLYNLSFFDAIRQIEHDLRINVLEDKIYTKTPVRRTLPIVSIETHKKEFIDGPVRFNAETLDYWAKYGVGESDLNYFEVRSVGWFKLIDKTKNAEDFTSMERNAFKGYPIFKYIYHGIDEYGTKTTCSNGRIKYYMPLDRDKRHRFLGNRTSNEVFGINQCNIRKDTPKIICAGEKDTISMRTTLGQDAISLQSETTLYIPELVLNLLDKVNVYVLYDNDDAGLSYADALSNRYNFINITPIFYEVCNQVGLVVREKADLSNIVEDNLDRKELIKSVIDSIL